MDNLYKIMDETNPNLKNILATVLTGSESGEKALFSEGKLCFESKQQGFFSRNRAKFLEIEESGISMIDEARVFCEVLGSEKKLVICGGGHVSIPVIKMGLAIGFTVTVLEDRPVFADNARRAGATNVICESFSQGLTHIEGDEDTFFVIVTRGHRYDQLCLESILKKPHAYIGMIGSKLRISKVRETMMEKGVDEATLNQVYMPIGLKIGAETPEEIGVSIIAELIKIKNAKRRNLGYSKELIRGIMEQDSAHSKKVLATIVSRKGSAPREVGTKMLILEDGKTVGTIGGGCVEADILQKALFMIRQEVKGAELHKVDMTGKDSEDEGMVCGGIIEVLLEAIW